MCEPAVLPFMPCLTIPWRNLTPPLVLVWLVANAQLRLQLSGIGEVQYVSVVKGAMTKMMATLLLTDRSRRDSPTVGRW